MQGYDYYKEQAFPVIYFISLYASMLFALIVSKIEASPNAKIYISYLLPQIIYLTTVAVYSAYAKVNVRKAIPFDFKVKFSKYAWAVILAVGLFCFALLPNVLIMELFKLLGFKPSVSVPTQKGGVDIVLSLIVICVLPALGEEIMFRGVLASSFKEYGGVYVIILSGLIFSFSHYNIAQTVYQFFLGTLLCYVFLKTNNLLFSVIVHFFNNALALFLPSVIPFFGKMNWSGQTFAVLIPMFIAGLFIFVLAIRKLTATILPSSDIITVFEYHPEGDSFVAVATENKNGSRENGGLKTIGYQIKQNFLAIADIFNARKTKEKIKAFKELYPQRKKINFFIKLTIAAIAVMWVIGVIL